MNNIVPTNNNLPVPAPRTPLTAQELWDLVDAELLVQTSAGNTFTAYTITKVLRANHPELEIQHIDVQARVHFQMEFNLNYQMGWQDWNGEPARTYYPYPTLSNGLAQQTGAALPPTVAPAATNPTQPQQNPSQQLPPGLVHIQDDDPTV